MGGKKAKKMKNSGPVKKDTEYADEEQYYAIADKFNSHSNIDLCFVDKDEKGKDELVFAIGTIRGKLIKRLKKIKKGDIFIITKRDFATIKQGEKQKVDIIHKYNDNERSHIINKFPQLLKSYNSNIDINASKDDNSDDDEIIFARDEKEKEDKRKKRLNNGPRSNTVTNNYLAGFDLPESDDGFTTDEEPFEGTTEDYQNKLIDSI